MTRFLNAVRFVAACFKAERRNGSLGFTQKFSSNFVVLPQNWMLKEKQVYQLPRSLNKPYSHMPIPSSPLP